METPIRLSVYLFVRFVHQDAFLKPCPGQGYPQGIFGTSSAFIRAISAVTLAGLSNVC